MPGSRSYVLMTMLAIAMVSARAARAQESEEEQKKEAAALARAAQNPVASMSSIPVQFNFYSNGGLGDATQVVTNVQPVLPLPINEKMNIISRTIVPFVSIPLADGERVTGIADIQQQIYFSPAHPGKLIWGVGPIFSFPTATNAAVQTGQFAIGPTVVLLTMTGPWVIGAVANNLWKFAGSDNTTAINSFFAQPFINYNLSRGWAISTAPAISADWNAASGQQWTVPLGLGVSKITRMGSQPINVLIQYYRNVVRPDAAGADVVRLQFALLYPMKQK